MTGLAGMTTNKINVDGLLVFCGSFRCVLVLPDIYIAGRICLRDGSVRVRMKKPIVVYVGTLRGPPTNHYRRH
jgi:hypothetical protein